MRRSPGHAFALVWPTMLFCAVFLSTRVVVMSPRPGKVAGIVNVDLPQPRTFDTREQPRYFELVTVVREHLRGVGAEEHGSVLAEAEQV